METKQCCTCNQCKEVSLFHRNKTQSDGFHKSCKKCRKEESLRYYKKNEEAVLERQKERYENNKPLYLSLMAEYRKANKESLSQKQKEYRQNNKELFHQKDKAYYEKNKDKFQEYREKNKEKRSLSFKQYSKNNRGRLAAIKAKRNAAKLKATPPWLSKEYLEQIRTEYELAAWCSKMMGIKYHVDHIIPLQGKQVCGLHVPWNLRVIPATENIRKGNKLDEHLELGYASVATKSMEFKSTV